MDENRETPLNHRNIEEQTTHEPSSQENITVILPSSRTAHADPQTAPITPSNIVASSPSSAKRTVRLSTLVVICLLCSLLTGGLCLAGYGLFAEDGGGTNTNNTNTGTTEGTTLSAQEDSNDSEEAHNGSETGDVTIQVENVTSPATAVAKKVLPSIVGIQVTTTSNSWYGQSSYVSSEGSGVIFSEDGYIITNYHVIESTLTTTGEVASNATLSIYLYTDAETAISGTVVGYDISADLAVLKINRTGLTAIELGNSDTLQVGDTAIALGNPGGLQFLGSVSQGIISGLNRTIQSDSAYENLTLIQTDAAINPGNSGGALADINGKLIGINSAKLVAEEYEGMGFSIPVNDVVTICTEIIKNGDKKIPYLGVELNTQYTAAYLEQLGYPGGVLVDSVASGSPAETGGIEVDDIIVSFNGTAITSADDLREAKNAANAGDTVTIQVYRLTSRDRFGRWSGEYIDISVTLG